MRLLRAVALMALTLLALRLAAEAQQSPGIARVGWLAPGPARAGGSMLNALREGLRELGHAEGRTVRFEPRWAEGRLDRLPALAEDRVRLKAQVVFAWGYPAIMAAKRATAAIPIVFLTRFDPVGECSSAVAGRLRG